MSSSYQKGGPSRIEQIGISAEELARRKKNRRLLFTGIGVVFLLVFGLLAFFVVVHQRRVLVPARNRLLPATPGPRVY